MMKRDKVIGVAQLAGGIYFALETFIVVVNSFISILRQADLNTNYKATFDVIYLLVFLAFMIVAILVARAGLIKLCGPAPAANFESRAQQNAAATSTASTASVAYCSKCGKPNAKTSAFCAGCGNALKAPDQQN